ncbi:MAG: HAMP domain-containing protein [Alphaproteobacteria bacterium]|nr:HAMP domain-containing protein [Alphaproteobacteria bacterium]
MDARVSKQSDEIRTGRWLRPPRSLAVRLAILYGAIFTLASAILVSVVSFTTIASLTKQRDEAISSELADLRTELAEGGITEVAHEIRLREGLVAKSQFIYSLYSKDDRLMAGTGPRVPHAAGWTNVQIPESAGVEPDAVRVRSLILPGEFLLSVGENTDGVDDVSDFLVVAFAIGLGATALLAIVGGVALSWTFGRRLDRVSRVCNEIMDGNLLLRVPARRRGDEIDLLATSINAMLDRIVSLMETLKQVSVDIAHDLRTPLTHLRQGLETTEQTARTTADYSSATRLAIGQVDGVLATFEALLRIAELDAGALRGSFVRVDLSAVVQNVAGAYGPPAEESGHRILSHIAEGIVVDGDEDLLTQLVANLIANGIRHTPRGTTISVDLRLDAKHHAVVTIADNGPGVPAADRERVFQRFVRLDRSRTTPGNGLGLSLCAAIARLHVASVQLSDNNPGLRCELTFEDSGRT